MLTTSAIMHKYLRRIIVTVNIYRRAHRMATFESLLFSMGLNEVNVI
jgi:hypothetical protein